MDAPPVKQQNRCAVHPLRDWLRYALLAPLP